MLLLVYSGGVWGCQKSKFRSGIVTSSESLDLTFSHSNWCITSPSISYQYPNRNMKCGTLKHTFKLTCIFAKLEYISLSQDVTWIRVNNSTLNFSYFEHLLRHILGRILCVYEVLNFSIKIILSIWVGGKKAYRFSNKGIW